jgi:uncharacterized membrane protein YjjB (DUF3815 family)
MSLATAIIQDAWWAGLAALGFAILFNVPVRTLAACAAAGAAGHAIRTVLVGAGLSLESATLAGATLVGLLGEAFARRWHTPTSIFTISGAIPMVPGKFAFETMIGLISLASVNSPASAALLVETSSSAVRTGVILAAITLGIAAPKLLFQRGRPAL